MYEATACILQAVAFFAISLYKRLADFLLAGEGQPITKEISIILAYHFHQQKIHIFYNCSEEIPI